MIRVDFSVPAEFAEMPLAMDFDRAWTQVNRRNAHISVTSDLPHEKLTEMARSLQQVSRILHEAGVVYAADCVHSFQGEPSLGSLAVAVVDFPYGNDPATAARGTLHGVLEARGPAWAGSVLDAPCGPVAIFTGRQNCTLPPAFSPDGEMVEVLTAQFHAVIPLPAKAGGDGRQMCLLAFSTPNVGHWENCYGPMVADVLRSFRFSEDGQGEGD